MSEPIGGFVVRLRVALAATLIALVGAVALGPASSSPSRARQPVERARQITDVDELRKLIPTGEGVVLSNGERWSHDEALRMAAASGQIYLLPDGAMTLGSPTYPADATTTPITEFLVLPDLPNRDGRTLLISTDVINAQMSTHGG